MRKIMTFLMLTTSTVFISETQAAKISFVKKGAQLHNSYTSEENAFLLSRDTDKDTVFSNIIKLIKEIAAERAKLGKFLQEESGWFSTGQSMAKKTNVDQETIQELMEISQDNEELFQSLVTLSNGDLQTTQTLSKLEEKLNLTNSYLINLDALLKIEDNLIRIHNMGTKVVAPKKEETSFLEEIDSLILDDEEEQTKKAQNQKIILEFTNKTQQILTLISQLKLVLENNCVDGKEKLQEFLEQKLPPLPLKKSSSYDTKAFLDKTITLCNQKFSKTLLIEEDPYASSFFNFFNYKIGIDLQRGTSSFQYGSNALFDIEDIENVKRNTNRARLFADKILPFHDLMQLFKNSALFKQGMEEEHNYQKDHAEYKKISEETRDDVLALFLYRLSKKIFNDTYEVKDNQNKGFIEKGLSLLNKKIIGDQRTEKEVSHTSSHLTMVTMVNEVLDNINESLKKEQSISPYSEEFIKAQGQFIDHLRMLMTHPDGEKQLSVLLHTFYRYLIDYYVDIFALSCQNFENLAQREKNFKSNVYNTAWSTTKKGVGYFAPGASLVFSALDKVKSGYNTFTKAKETVEGFLGAQNNEFKKTVFVFKGLLISNYASVFKDDLHSIQEDPSIQELMDFLNRLSVFENNQKE